MEQSSPHSTQPAHAGTARRILIDGRNLGLDKGTGVATYARNLSYCLHDLGFKVEVLYGGRSAPGWTPLMREIAFFDAHAGDVPRWLRALRALREALYSPLGHPTSVVPMTGAVVRDAFRSRLPYFDTIYNSPDLFQRAHWRFGLVRSFPRIRMASKPDLAHWTYPLPMRVSGRPNVYTLHDLVPLRLPYTTLDNKRRYFKLIAKIARKADHIVTVSESSKRDIQRMFNVEDSRITNTYQCASIPRKYQDAPIDAVERAVSGTFGLDYKGYYLFWGSIEPKKNIGRLIEAYLASRVTAPLVVVGAQAWKSEEELRLLYDDNIRSLIQVGNETRYRSKVVQLNYAPFPLLVSLIRGAKATLFPSLYEGFGLPVLESMQLKTPVISSNTASIPEVAGDAAILVDPYDTAALTSAIRRLDADSGLRDELVRRGVEQSRKFSEDAYRERLRSVYDALI